MSHNDLGAFASNNLTGGWTSQAIDCWRIDCLCDCCDIPKKMKSTKCQMKATVLELVKLYGTPTMDNTRRDYCNGTIYKKRAADIETLGEGA